MKKFFAILFLFFSTSVFADEKFIEIKIPCIENSEVKATLPEGEEISLGRVLMTPSKTNYPAYTASKWGENSSVCATAVNAIHILLNVENDRGRIISLVPSVTIAPAAGRGSFFSIECEAGTGIFGGLAPLTGSKVFIERDGVEIPLTDVPKSSDVLIIRTKLPESQEIFMVDIENRPGGRVIAHGSDGVKVIARVIHSVGGVGRFEGTKFQSVGRIRASHSGVIDVSTSKRGLIGGIQIMPLKHALTSKEMINAWKLTQWMIISPLPNAKDLEGQRPLFKESFVPGTQLNDKLPDLFSQYGRKSLILCRKNGGEWERLPEFSGRVDDALKDITHLRLYFPFWKLKEQ
ncbi:MAG: hypothetical protein IJ597_06470 [Synergistaceae bacterium]|nr:hypothetical protein [Synergistaceae bacterium]